MKRKQLDTMMIRKSFELANKTLYVERGSSFKSRLQNLSEEIGSYINVIEPNELSVEELIAKVSKGEIDYTISDNHIAMVNSSYYDNIPVQWEWLSAKYGAKFSMGTTQRGGHITK